jgi:hypothetical protein
MARRFQVVIDAADPRSLARFWAEALGYIEQPPPEGFDSWDAFADSIGMSEEERSRYGAVIDPDGNGPRVFFQGVPEAKRVKNRVHLDIRVADPEAPRGERDTAIESEVTRLESLGARRLAAHEEFGFGHVVMADPEGNEFCVT